MPRSALSHHAIAEASAETSAQDIDFERRSTTIREAILVNGGDAGGGTGFLWLEQDQPVGKSSDFWSGAALARSLPWSSHF